MKKSWRSKLQVNIILLLFCMESCCCVGVDRGSQDQIDLIQKSNCEDVSGAFYEKFRCKCSVFRPNILSRNTGQVQCLKDADIDSSKYILIIFD